MDVFIKFAINFAVSNQKKQQVMKKVKLLFILSLLFCLVPRAITKNTSLNAVQERNISLSESWEVVRGNPTVLFVISGCWGIAGVIDRLLRTFGKYSLGKKQILYSRN